MRAGTGDCRAGQALALGKACQPEGGHEGHESFEMGMWGRKIDDVLGVWPLHGLGGVSFSAQLIRTAIGVGWALLSGFVVYGLIKSLLGLRLTQEEEYEGADVSIHRIGSTPDREVNW